MDFGYPKELRFFNDLRPIPGSESFWRGGGGGGHVVTDFVTGVMRPKYLLKKSDTRCALTHLANKKYDSVSWAIRITFKQVWKQPLKVKNSIKRLLNAIFWLDF